MTSAIVAALHFLALGIGLGSVFVRGRKMREVAAGNAAALPALFRADALWGIAALLWLATGGARAFAGLEKGTEFYLQSHTFWLKMGMFGLVFVLELWPMVTFIRWRIALGKGGAVPQFSVLNTMKWINDLEVVLVVVIVFVASIMARGLVQI